MLTPDALARALRQLQIERVVNRAGYVSVQCFYLYAERGLACRRVSVWLYDGRLHLAYRQALLAQYIYRAERRGKRLRAVAAVDPHPQLYRTIYPTFRMDAWCTFWIFAETQKTRPFLRMSNSGAEASRGC